MKIVVRKLRIIFLGLAMLVPNYANATLLTFDDIPGGSIQGNVGDMPTYLGFNFSFTLDWIDVVGSTWNYGAHSGDFAILNNNGGIGTITAADGSDFTFDGLWAKRWATGIESGGIDTSFGTLRGYNNGQLIWNISTSVNGSYEYYVAQAGMIDELRLGFGNIFLVDDLCLNGGNCMTSTISEPAPLILLGFGFVGICLARRRRI